jgi:hypothetical protein
MSIATEKAGLYISLRNDIDWLKEEVVKLRTNNETLIQITKNQQEQINHLTKLASQAMYDLRF